MAIRAKPRTSYDRKSGAFNSVCGGSPFRKREQGWKQAYIDTDYKLKAALGIPKLLMPYDIRRIVETDDPKFSERFNGFTSFGTCFGSISSGPGDRIALDQASSKASSVFYKKLASENSFNLGVALGEMKETVGLISFTAARLATSYRFLRKGRVKDAFSTLGIADSKRIHGLKGVPRNSPTNWTAKRHRKQLENRVPKSDQLPAFAAKTWLEIQYGWTPLLYDVYGSAEYVAKLLHASDTDLIVKGAGTGNYTHTVSTSDFTATVNVKAIRKYIVHLKVKDPLLRNASSLGLTNPLLIAWELTPFSFVADWFLPVGDYLGSLSSYHGYAVVASSTSTKVAESGFGRSINPSYPGFLTRHDERFTRVLGGTPSYPFPQFDFQNALSWKKAATSLSLLKVVFLNK